MEFSTTVRLAVYRHFADTGTAPSAALLAKRLRSRPDEVKRAFGLDDPFWDPQADQFG